MKIIGNGMIAKSFKDYDFGSVCVFASGVSDSTESDASKYLKEYELVKKTLNENQDNLFIYFSTLSVFKYDYTDYIKHKLFIEFYIKSTCNNFMILRLPNIVGVTKSQNQLLPFIYSSLLNKKTIKVNDETYRDLIDVDDLPKIIKSCIDNELCGVINTSLNNKIKVTDIINYIAQINDITEPQIDFIDINQNIVYDSDINHSKIKNVILDPYKIIQKYYSK